MSNTFPLLNPTSDIDTKDPCPVFDGVQWHLFGSGGTVKNEKWDVFHATALHLEGPWTERDPIRLDIEGSGVAAPGVIFEDETFHMFIQTEFMKEGGIVKYLISYDGFEWIHMDTILEASPETGEHGIYDPHPAVINGHRYIVYSGMPAGHPQPDIFLAESTTNTWDGPWVRCGKILDHQEIADHHNQKDHHDYEWGIEGAQLVEMPNGQILLNATCFLPQGPRGSRQRVFFALADSVMGPYTSIGPVIEPDECGENGHSTAIIKDDRLLLCYQSRLDKTSHLWRYGLREFAFSEIRVP
jgi:hypothetical protein